MELYLLFGLMFLMVLVMMNMSYKIFNLEQVIKDQISIIASKEVLDGDNKKLMSQRNTEIKFNIEELKEQFRLRTSLLLDRMDDLCRTCLKKDEFDRLFELIRREKIILDNTVENVEKKKWDNLKMAFSGKKEQKE